MLSTTAIILLCVAIALSIWLEMQDLLKKH